MGDPDSSSAHAQSEAGSERDPACEPGGRVGHPQRPRLEGRRSLTEPDAFPAPWPPGPSGDWSAIPERFWPAVESSICRVDDGPTISRLHRGSLDETQHDPQASTESAPEHHDVRMVRGNREAAASTPLRLQQADGDHGSMPEMPRQGRQASRAQGRTSPPPTHQAEEGVCDLRGAIHASAQHKPDMLEGVLQRAWASTCGEALERTLSCQGLRLVRERVRARAGAGENVLAVLREQARMVQALRTDRLRALGNGVVPACAARALLDLSRRAGVAI